MYSVYHANTYREFETYDELLNYLSAYTHSCGTEKYNSILDYTGVNDYDCYRSVSYSGEVEYYQRTNRIYHDGIAFYSHKLVRDVFNYNHDPDRYYRYLTNDRIKNKLVYCGHRYIPRRSLPRYRIDPIPGTHKRTRYSNALRHVQTTHEKRVNADPEVEKYVRPCRRFGNLVDLYCDIPREYGDDGWKSQTKNRHQWESKVVRTSKKSKAYVVKNYTKYEAEELDIENIHKQLQEIRNESRERIVG